MSTTNRKLRVLAALIAVFLLALAAGCRGFFVNPVLTTITVGPSGQNVEQGKTLQMSARGTYDDGSVKNLTTGVSWDSSDKSVATISTSGLVTAVAPGTSTITAFAETISGTATVTVVIPGVTGVTISPSSVHGSPGNTLPFTCAASPGNVPITTSAVWTVSDTTNLHLTTNVDPVTVQIDAAAPNGNYSVTCSYTVSGTTFQSTAPIIVP